MTWYTGPWPRNLSAEDHDLLGRGVALESLMPDFIPSGSMMRSRFRFGSEQDEYREADHVPLFEADGPILPMRLTRKTTIAMPPAPAVPAPSWTSELQHDEYDDELRVGMLGEDGWHDPMQFEPDDLGLVYGVEDPDEELMPNLHRWARGIPEAVRLRANECFGTPSIRTPGSPLMRITSRASLCTGTFGRRRA